MFAMVVKVQVSDSDWSIVTKYWKDLEKHFTHPDDREKIDFLNRVVFESAGSNTLHSQSSITVTTIKRTKAAVLAAYDKYTRNIPLVSNEIDNELDDLKTVDDEMEIDSKIKTFIVEPV